MSTNNKLKLFYPTETKKNPKEIAIKNIIVSLDILFDKFKKLEKQSKYFRINNDTFQIRELLQEFTQIKNEIFTHCPEIHTNLLDQTIHRLEQAAKLICQPHNKELEDIRRGLYQKQLYSFTYDLPFGEEGSRLSKNPIEKIIGRNHRQHQDRANYLIYPLMDQHGLKCTAAISKQVPTGLEPIEIQINFFGTIDFASELADMERGGPGQRTLKKHEAKLSKQINSLLGQMSAAYPNKTFKLRLAGHSLGGALAKGFAHSMQRACAIQGNTPEAIMAKIKSELTKETEIKNTISPTLFQSLEKKFNTDKDKFNALNSFSKIEGITVYALGAPGLGKTTDRHASLLSYYYQPDFLSVYNHYHREDIIPKFGDTEFLSGKNGIIPRIITNKAIQYEVGLTEEEVSQHKALPFPGITKRVMAAHNKLIYNSNQNIQSTVTELTNTNHMLEKFTFSVFKRCLYETLFFFARFLALFKLPGLESFPISNIGEPNIISPVGSHYFSPRVLKIS